MVLIIQITVHYKFTVPTACSSRPSTKMVALSIFACMRSSLTVSWPNRLRLRDENWPKGDMIYIAELRLFSFPVAIFY